VALPVRPPEDRRRRPRLEAASATDGMDARETEGMVTSEVPTHVQVSLIDRGSDSLRPASRRRLLDSSPLVPRHHTCKNELASGGWGSDRGGRGETLRCVWMCGSTMGTWTPPLGEVRPAPRGTLVLHSRRPGVGSCANLEAVHIPRDHPDTDEQLLPLAREERTQAFHRAVRRAVTRALPQAVMTARPGLARMCR